MKTKFGQMLKDCYEDAEQIAKEHCDDKEERCHLTVRDIAMAIYSREGDYPKS